MLKHIITKLAHVLHRFLISLVLRYYSHFRIFKFNIFLKFLVLLIFFSYY